MAIFPGKLECNLIAAVTAPHHLWGAAREKPPQWSGGLSLSLSLSKAEPLSLDRVLLARILQKVLVKRKFWLHIVSKLLRDMGFGHGPPTHQTLSQLPVNQPATFRFPLGLIFCGVAKALSLIMI
jgi:hypothetical protein